MVDGGRMLVFDNGLRKSRILELDPLTNKIVWHYGPVKEFFTKSRGSNQRLANGNTLITESDRGYVFEVTPEGEVVWRFANPVVRGNRRDPIWRMTRFQPETLEFLKNR